MLRDDLKQACQCTARGVRPLPAPELSAMICEGLFVRELRGEDLVFISESKTGLEDRSRWAIRAISDGLGDRVFANEDLELDLGRPGPAHAALGAGLLGRAGGHRVHRGEPEKFFAGIAEHGRQWFAYQLARDCGTWDVRRPAGVDPRLAVRAPVPALLP